MSIAIIKYSSSNVSSLSNCLKSIGVKHYVCSSQKDLNYASTIILPGVGTFEGVLDEIKKNNTYKTIIEKANQGNKIIGICIGMQILAETGNELRQKKSKGLGLIKAEVKKMNSFHIGWNKLQGKNFSKKFNKFSNQSFYFNHSNYLKLKNTKNGIFYSYVNDIEIPSLIINKNILGFQFHPEKSQIYGKKILKHLIEENLCTKD